MPTRSNSETTPQNPRTQGKNIVIANMLYPEAPLLQLYVNPNSLNTTYTKQVSTTRTRAAVVEEHWGIDALTQISGSGDTLSFSEYGDLKNESDLQNPDGMLKGWKLVAGLNRHGTPQLQNLHELIQLFLNAGTEFNSLGQPNRWNGLLMLFDNNAYFGYFENFQITESSDKPNTYNYSFSFKVTLSLVQRLVRN